MYMYPVRYPVSPESVFRCASLCDPEPSSDNPPPVRDYKIKNSQRFYIIHTLSQVLTHLKEYPQFPSVQSRHGCKHTLQKKETPAAGGAGAGAVTVPCSVLPSHSLHSAPAPRVSSKPVLNTSLTRACTRTRISVVTTKSVVVCTRLIHVKVTCCEVDRPQ